MVLCAHPNSAVAHGARGSIGGPESAAAGPSRLLPREEACPYGLGYLPWVRTARDTLRAAPTGYGWVRLLPLLGAAGTVGLLHIPQVAPSTWDWCIALVSAAVLAFGGRLPLTVTLVQCALLVLAATLAPQGATVAQILTCVGLGELALRRTGVPVWAGAAAVAVASGLNSFPGYEIAANVLIVLLQVGLPLLLGAFLRAQRELAEQARKRVAEVENARHWEARAARAVERASVAHELHDVIAHHVAAIVLRVGVARHVVPDVDPELDEALRDVHEIGGQALTDLRRMVAVLRDPDTVDRPSLLAPADLGTALEEVVDRTRQAGVPVRAEVHDGALDELDVEGRHAVLRVVQEGLTNVLKHAGHGVRADLRVYRDGEMVRVELVDRGGLAAPAGDSPPGHGLFMMRERIELMRGTLDAGPDDSGWRLRAGIPSSPSRAAQR